MLETVPQNLTKQPVPEKPVSKKVAGFHLKVYLYIVTHQMKSWLQLVLTLQTKGSALSWTENTPVGREEYFYAAMS